MNSALEPPSLETLPFLADSPGPLPLLNRLPLVSPPPPPIDSRCFPFLVLEALSAAVRVAAGDIVPFYG